MQVMLHNYYNFIRQPFAGWIFLITELLIN